MSVDKIFGFCKKHKRALKFWSLIFVISAMLFKGVMQIPQIRQNKNTVATLEERIEYEQTRQEEIEELKTKVDSDEYIEKIASEKLGLVKNNAKIFVDVSEGQ